MKPIKLTDAQMDAALDWKLPWRNDWHNRLAVAVNAFVRDRGHAPTLLQLAGMAEVAIAQDMQRELTHVEKTLLGALK